MTNNSGARDHVGPDASSGQQAQRASYHRGPAALRAAGRKRASARRASQRPAATPVSTSANENAVETLGYSFPAISTYGYTK